MEPNNNDYKHFRYVFTTYPQQPLDGVNMQFIFSNLLYNIYEEYDMDYINNLDNIMLRNA